MLLVPGILLAGDVKIQDPWIAEPPPGVKMLGGYMVIQNGSDKDLLLTGATVEGVKMVEIHRTVMKGDMAQMMKQKDVNIPAGGQLVMKPGDYHLMLMHPLRPFKQGEQVKLQLLFQSGLTVSAIAEVRTKKH